MAPDTTPGLPPRTPLAAVATRAAALIADKDAVEHVMDVLTSTLRSASMKDNPSHLVHDHVTIDKALDFFTLDEAVLSGDIPLFRDVDNGITETDVKGNDMFFYFDRSGDSPSPCGLILLG
jgi:hypothetical protein